jgi:FkbM family methyltransferase
MAGEIRGLLKSVLRSTGRELRVIDTPMRSLARGIELLSKLLTPASVIDIGVADGTPELYSSFPQQRYLLIEANPHFAERLQQLTASMNAVAENLFCGSQAGSVMMNVYNDPRKSSAYALNRTLALDKQIQVPVVTLDELVAKHQLAPPYLLKLDVEGAELEVLRGASRTLAETEAVIAEASVLPRFQGAPEFSDLVAALAAAGFSVFDIVAGYNQPTTGYLQQVDLIFVRTGAAFRQGQR